ncbi:histidine kinase dimerization/phospho-acceptor domain-containing protein [uncultured Thermanaerothrix sp.]|uniref:histidine kinase dimerization/phospho-acceptor domain-containing protein n=1 Tax=uncultured Thermanaerothrix sp. TaxID=1195149 RepID=UPI00261D6215|nr:histidine kinase dimerization/phospho-acceptor domain-containing protein [uncultured Thermanaerothrix sp.]
MTPIEQLLSSVVSPPGNLLFHLVLAFSVLFALQNVILWPLDPSPSIRRTLYLGLTIALAGQLFLFISAGLTWQNLLVPSFFIPALERMVLSLTLFWVGRLWLFPAPNARIDRLSLVFTLLIPLLFLVELLYTPTTGIDLGYNATLFDQLWTVIIIAFSSMALVIALTRSSPIAGEGFGIMGFILAGGLLHYALDAPQSNISATLRLAQLCAYPLLPAMVQHVLRLNTTIPVSVTPEPFALATQPTTTPLIQAIFAWSDVAGEIGKVNLLQTLTRAIAHTFRADLCLILQQNKTDIETFTVEAGYDLVRDEPIAPSHIRTLRFRKLLNAIRHQKSLLFEEENTLGEEGQALASALGLEHTGSLIATPIEFPTSRFGLVVLLTPYSNRAWTPEELTRLQALNQKIATLLKQDEAFHHLQSQVSQLEQALQSLEADLEKMQTENRSLRQVIEAPKPTSPSTPSDDLEALLALQHEAQDMIEALQAENRALREMLAESQEKSTSSPEVEHLENELRSTLEEIARLQNALAEANIQILKLQQSARQPSSLPPTQQEVLISLIQEMRQPLSSILGYVDLLMGETVGILSTLQRKFLERTRVATVKTRDLLEQLLDEISTLAAQSPEDVSVIAEIGPIIDQALNDLAPQIQQREINVHLDLPADVPKVRLNSDNLYQILVHLLQQLVTSATSESDLTLRILRETTLSSPPFLLLQISNTPWEKMETTPRQLLRETILEESLLQELDKERLNLGLIKALIETNGGRIYVDSDSSHAITVSLLLPIEALGTVGTIL